jgi:hypothetical protein
MAHYYGRGERPNTKLADNSSFAYRSTINYTENMNMYLLAIDKSIIICTYLFSKSSAADINNEDIFSSK